MKNIITIFSKQTTLFLILAISFATLLLPLTSLRASTLTNGMDASWVIGQSDFETFDNGVDQNGGSFPLISASDGSRLFVLEAMNRVLVYDISDGLTNGENAVNVLGQANFTSSATGTTASTFNFADNASLIYGENKLFVSDSRNNRVLVFDVTAITNGESAVNVLGQADFTSSATGTTDSTFNLPGSLAYDSTSDRLFVSDSTNNRVLVFSVTSITDGESAVKVLGQSNFTTVQALQVTARAFDFSEGASVSYGDNQLFVSDGANNRVLVFDVTAITNGENAVNVLGQADFTSSATGTTAGTLNIPISVTYDSNNERIFVSDSVNLRSLVFDVAAITNGEDAVNVLGQADFVSSATGTGAAWISQIYGANYDATNDYLFISDLAGSIMVFDLGATVATSSGLNYTHPPLCTATLTPSTITKGEQATLSWNIKWPTDRQSIYYTKIPKNGLYSDRVSSITISPEHTTTYRIATFNLWGANFCESTITVLNEQGEELTSPKNSLLTAGAGNSPFAKAILNFFRSIFSR